jgi:hypothetical protein
MYNWAGNFKLILIPLFILALAASSQAAEEEFKFNTAKWEEFAKEVELQKERDRRNGLSYMISGSLALVGGIVGNGLAEDTAERGIYTVFQTIGVASIGYGAYTWQVGGEERFIYSSLQYSKLSPEQKTQFLKAYNLNRKERERRERVVRAVTHGLIAALNFYNASQQSQDSLKTTLAFVGGVNLLAAVSYTFEF